MTPLQAGHIIGGEMTYTCIGNGNYAFQMRVYRDCGCDNCAVLGVANIAVYRCEDNQTCGNLNQDMVFKTADVAPTELNAVPQPSVDCMISPPFVCVEEGVYEFDFFLPISTTETYHVVYQRCCRNETINNIINPGDSGATFNLEIPPNAQTACNNSPVFNDFPPTLICVNDLFQFNHSATDIDGDSLVYAFCSPLLGGGTSQTDNVCDSPSPTPSCPPPFLPVNFIEPLYSANSPVTGNPALSIDASTGQISGAPDVQGQFVVGVCVSEYRNGQLLGSIKRDFQFNITNCEDIVEANIVADERINYNTFAISSCGDSVITIQNISTLDVFIEDWQWEFDWDGQAHFFEEWSPTIIFPRTNESYLGSLVLNPGTDCGDTAYIQVNIYPEIEAAFSWEQDSCQEAPIPFNNFSEPSQTLTYLWDFGDGETATTKQSTHSYNTIGIFQPSLIVEDTTGCRDTTIHELEYFPLPNSLQINMDDAHICLDETVSFSNISSPLNENYSSIWSFEDSIFLEGQEAIYSYSDIGIYAVHLAVTNPFGCQIDSTFEGVIQVEPYPMAEFSFQPQEISSLFPDVHFTDESKEATNWLWDFGNGDISTLQNPNYTYADTGQFQVQLIVSNLADCMDSAVHTLRVIPEVAYFLPNAFTPNYDGVNDIFVGTGRFEYITNFQLTIWNRWGELVFQTNNPTEGWNGKKNNMGAQISPGVYVYKVDYENPQGKKVEQKGFVTLIR